MGAANLIGKFVTSDSSRVLHTQGKYSDITFDLPADAKDVHLSLLNEKGEIVREFDRKDLKKGPNTVEWDGRKSNNMAVPTGTYMVQINARGEEDKPIPVQTSKTAVVHGVAFEGKDTVLLTGDLTKPTRIFLKHVTKIVDARPQETQVGGIPLPAGLQQQGGAQENPDERQMAAAIDSTARNVPGLEHGVAENFTPINVDDIRKGDQKPAPPPERPSNDQIRKALEAAQDLSDFNPVAAQIARGRGAQAAPPPAPPPAQTAPRQGVPSGEENSTAGKLAE
jgi:hypothetical protein